MPRHVDLNDIRLLIEVLGHGSYTAASRATGVPKSTISQRIAALERTVGTGLLRRTSRSFSLTEAGNQLLPHARAIEESARQIERSLLERGCELRGTLRIAASSALAQFALAPLVPQFLALHAMVTVRVETTNRLVDIIGEGYDMAVRGHKGSLKDSTLIQRVVARAPWWLAASTEWIHLHGDPQAPEDLPPDRILCWSMCQERHVLKLRKAGEERDIEISPRLISDDMSGLRASTLAGGGVTSLPTYILRSALEAGDLVRILPDWEGEPSTISVLTPPKLQSSKLAGAFSDFLAAELPKIVNGDAGGAKRAVNLSRQLNVLTDTCERRSLAGGLWMSPMNAAKRASWSEVAERASDTTR